MTFTKSTVRCETPRCIDTIAQYGEIYHGVYEREEGEQTIHLCERCGGKRQPDGSWRHRCKTCSVDVAPGLLTGLFVPHLCAGCLETARAQQRAHGDICLGCKKPSCDCYC